MRKSWFRCEQRVARVCSTQIVALLNESKQYQNLSVYVEVLTGCGRRWRGTQVQALARRPICKNFFPNAFVSMPTRIMRRPFDMCFRRTGRSSCQYMKKRPILCGSAGVYNKVVTPCLPRTIYLQASEKVATAPHPPRHVCKC